MQGLEVSGAVRPIYGSLGVKRLADCNTMFNVTSTCYNTQTPCILSTECVYSFRWEN